MSILFSTGTGMVTRDGVVVGAIARTAQFESYTACRADSAVGDFRTLRAAMSFIVR